MTQYIELDGFTVQIKERSKPRPDGRVQKRKYATLVRDGVPLCSVDRNVRVSDGTLAAILMVKAEEKGCFRQNDSCQGGAE